MSKQERKFLETDEEFVSLLPQVVLFSQKTGTPTWSNVGEVVMGFKSKHSLTYIEKTDGVVTKYCHGYFISQTEFMVTQVLWEGAKHLLGDWNIYVGKIKEMGGTKVMCTTFLDPVVFEKYGFKFDRFLLSKYL